MRRKRRNLLEDLSSIPFHPRRRGHLQPRPVVELARLVLLVLALPLRAAADVAIYQSLVQIKGASAADKADAFAEALRTIDTPRSLEILEKIFKAGDAAVKVKALQAMQNLKEFDEAFLFPILEKKNPLVQAEALMLMLLRRRSSHLRCLPPRFSHSRTKRRAKESGNTARV